MDSIEQISLWKDRGIARVPHPAKFSDAILDTVGELWQDVAANGPVLDPFAGTGRVHGLADRLGVHSIGVELEPEWAALSSRTLIADALNLPFADRSFGAVITSPCYGNRMADHHEARDTSKRNTYRHTLGRPLSPGSSAGLQWGDSYQAFHRLAWREVHRTLADGGYFFLNVSDHVRKGILVEVSAWHAAAALEIGFLAVATKLAQTPRQRFGANGLARAEYEHVFVFAKRQQGDSQ